MGKYDGCLVSGDYLFIINFLSVNFHCVDSAEVERIFYRPISAEFIRADLQQFDGGQI